MTKCRANDEMGSDYTAMRGQTLAPDKPALGDYVPSVGWRLEGLAMPGTRFDNEAAAYDAGFAFIRSRMDENHLPGSFRVVAYATLAARS